ncbi:MAG TPA: FAD-dependent oxidoreductase, partial [Orrella sp.]
MSKEIHVPNIGDFKDVEIIEILVSEGDTIEAEQSLITVESDKASMEIPATDAGKITKLLVKVGDKVNEGSPIAQIEEVAGGAAAPAAAPKADAPKSEAPKAETAKSEPAPAAAVPAAPVTATPPKGPLVVLGAGPGGYSAAFRAADLGMEVILIERYPTLGGVCLNVGCIPSKALLHTASVMEEAQGMAAHGISFGKPEIDLDKLREFKSGVIGKLTGGLAGMAKARKVRVVNGVAEFTGPNSIEVKTEKGSETIEFGQAIIAAGSQSVKLPFMPDDPRVVDSTGALELAAIPKRMLIVGGGIIGLEMGTVYSALGARLDVVEMLDGLMLGADKDLVKVWIKKNEHRFDNIMLKTKTVGAEAKKDGIHVTFEGEGENSAAPKEPQVYDLVLQAVGRSPNGKKIAADKAGVAVTDRGFIEVDNQMRTNVPHIFAIGD